MHLWNDYEGTTLAGRWTLGRLLRTEGRSALFATERPDGGGPAVLRLTEALNDQAVLQARYRAIQAAGDRFLVTVESYGDAEFDGTPLSYAVLEPTQESLADILATRRLGTDETQEVAVSVAGGLLALHGQGLVHGLVEPESVVAAGERIKLRSDCARPAPNAEDALLENAVTPQTDAFGLAGVIYRSLTQNRMRDAADALALPEPFATIVRNAARGSWGVAEIAEELKRQERAAPAARPSQPAAAAASVSPGAVPASGAASPGAGRGGDAGESRARGLAAADGSAGAGLAGAGLGGNEAREESGWQQPGRISAGVRRGIGIAVGVVVLLVLLFAFFHHRAGSAPVGGAVDGPTAAAPTAATPDAAPTTAASLAPRVGASAAAPRVDAGAGVPAGQQVWRVIAYTYNRKAEAEAKAASLNRRFPNFNAAEWSRTGQKPFLVTLGGEMQEKQAFALRYRARRSGVAPDVYAQNFAR